MCYRTAASREESFCIPTVHISSTHTKRVDSISEGIWRPVIMNSLCAAGRKDDGYYIWHLKDTHTFVRAHQCAHTCSYANIKTPNSHTAQTGPPVCHSIFSKELRRFYASVRSNGCSVLCCWLGDFSCILALLEAWTYNYRLLTFPKCST